MIVHREIRPFLDRLEAIYRRNRKAHASRQAFMLYCILVDVMLYWRHLERWEFHRLPPSAQDELYYWFTEKLLHICDQHVDLYWLIRDVDDKPLFTDGREPAPFWRKRVQAPQHQLKRMEYA
ncbi:hypothetical protein [Pseudohaliea sp.]|uniref:hypothetical protein n=1 Tax=Pseudohaliea sp. TaxID=2740289 RepID=UPI0032EED8F7